MTSLLYKIMRRIGGPNARNRRILLSCSVTSGTIYGAQIWHKTLKHQHYRNLLTTINRKLAVLITSAYRTAPTVAIEATLGMIPIDLLNVTKWKESKLGETNYSTQAITERGVFGSDLKKKFTEIRTEAEEKCNAIINKQNISEILTNNQACWKGVTKMLEEIMTIQTEEERRRERE
ncbi:hypothetical protein HUJ05_003286 [Dendroctonus ponderosae]|nr:hypothetical protein HUJ05_003286 [Dendroctonus ponderosae]